MDPQKKATVLQYIGLIWGQKVDKLLDLTSGHFFLHVLGLLEQWSKKDEPETDEERLLCVKTFLQDFYGSEVQIDEFLNFDGILKKNKEFENDLDLEVAKIAVVLLGIGVLDKNGQQFIEPAMQLPPELHSDIMAIIQSVVQAGSAEVVLTSSIENILREPSATTKEERPCLEAVSPIKSVDRNSPPLCNLQKSQFMVPSETSTPKESRMLSRSMAAAASASHKDSPLKSNTSLLNYSLRDITSPLRGLSLSTALPSSPLVQFVQSPELRQKAVIKQKELEIRKLKQQLNDQIFLREEMEFTLQDHISGGVKKDAEINKLQERVKELLRLKDGYDELQEMKLKYNEMETDVVKLNEVVRNLERYKEECQYLEKESHSHYEEMDKLQQEIKSLELENSKHKDLLKEISHLKTNVTTLELQLEEMNKFKSEWEEEKGILQGNFEMAKEKNEKLTHELEELQAQSNDKVPGESMGIFLDIQMGELKCQYKEVKQERDSLKEQLDQLMKSSTDKERDHDQLRIILEQKEKEFEQITGSLVKKESEVEELKENINKKDLEIEEMKADIESREKELEQTQNSVLQKNSELEELNAAKGKMAEESEVLRSQLNTKLEECVSNSEQIEDLHKRNSGLEKELDLMSESLRSMSEVKEHFEEGLKAKEEELIILQNDLSEMSQSLSALKEDKDKLVSELTHKNEENSHFMELLDKQKIETAHFEGELKEKCAIVEELESALETKSTLLLEQQDNAKAMAEDKNALVNKYEQLKAECEDKDHCVALAQSQVQQLKKDMHEREIELGNVNDEVSKLKQAVDVKSSQCSDLQHELSEKAEELSSAQTKTFQVVEDLNEKCAEVANLLEEITASKHCLESKDSQIKDLTEQAKNLESQVGLLSGQLQGKTEECLSTSERVTDLTAQISNLERDLSSKSAEIETLSSELTSKTNSISQLQSELSSQFNDKMEENKKLSEDLFAKEEELARMMKEATETSETAENLLKQINEKDEVIQSLQETETTLRLSIEEQSNKATDLRKELEQANDNNARLVAENEQLKTELQNSDLSKEALMEEIEKIKQEAAEVAENLKDTVAVFSEAKNDLEKAKDERDQFESDLTAKCSEIMSLSEEISHLKVEVSSKVSSSEEAQEKVKEALENCQAVTVERDSLQGELSVKIKSITELSTEKEELLKTLAAKSADLTILQDKELHLMKKMEQVQGEKEQAESQIEKNNAEIFNLNKELDGETQLLDQVEKKVLELQIEISEQSQKNVQLGEEVGNLKQMLSVKDDTLACQIAEIEKKSQDLEESKQAANELRDKLLEIEASQHSYREDKCAEIESLKAEIETLSASMTKTEEAKEQEMCLLKEQIKQNTEELLHKKEELADFIKTVAAMTADLESKDASISDLNTKFEKEKEKTSELEESVEEKTQEIATMSAKVEEQSSTISELTIVLESKELKSSELSQQLEEECSKFVKLSERFESTVSENAELTEQLRRKTLQAEETNSKLSSTQRELQEKITSLALIGDETLSKNALFAEKEEELRKISDEKQELSKLLNEQQSSVQHLEEQLKSLTEMLQKNTEELTKKDEMIASKDSSLQFLKALESELTEIKSKYEEKNYELELVTEQLVSKDAVIVMKDKELTTAQNNLESIQQTLSSREEELHLKDEQISEITQTQQETQRQILVIEEIFAQKESELEHKLLEITSALDEKKSELQNKEMLICSLREEHEQEMTTVKEETSNMLEDLRVKFEAAKESEINALSEQRTELEAQSADMKSEHESKFSKAVEDFNQQAATMETQYNKKFEVMKTEKENLEQNIATLKEQYEQQIQTTDSENQSKLQQLYEALKLEQQTQKEIDQELSTQRAVTARLEEAVKKEREEREEIVRKIVEENEKKISSMEQNQLHKVEVLETEKEWLTEEKNKLESTVYQLNDTIRTLQSELATYKTRTESLESQMVALKVDYERKLTEQSLAIEKDKLENNKLSTLYQTELEEKVQTKEHFEQELKDLQLKYDNVLAEHDVKKTQLSEEIQQLHAQEEEYKSTIESLEAQHTQSEKKIKHLQEESISLRERENKRLKESDAQMRKANEFCNDLRKQLEATKKKLETSEREMKNASAQYKRQEVQISSMKETSLSLTDALKIERQTNAKMQKKMEEYSSKYEDMKVKYEPLLKENKTHAAEVNRLKTALDYSDRKLREYQHQLDQAGTALLGDSSHFNKIIAEKAYDSLDDSVESKGSGDSGRSLRSRTRLSIGSNVFGNSPNETILSGDRVMLKRETLATGDLREKVPGSKRLMSDRMSICSTSSSQSIKSLNGVPAGFLPNAMSCANEPEGPEFEWDRLSELQRRNTLYLPHLKSAYPVEMQSVRKEKFTDDSLRLSLMPTKNRQEGKDSNPSKSQHIGLEPEAKSSKRKAPVKESSEELSDASPPKQKKPEISPGGTIIYYPVVRTAPVYQRPGPPTPGKQPRRISGRFTPSHGGVSPNPSGKIKALGSPIARPNNHQPVNNRYTPKKRTPRRSPRIKAQKSPAQSSNHENDDRRESVAFNIGFTPMKSSGPGRFLKSKVFGSKNQTNNGPSSSTTEMAKQVQKSKKQQEAAQVSYIEFKDQELYSNTCNGNAKELLQHVSKAVTENTSGISLVDNLSSCDRIEKSLHSSYLKLVEEPKTDCAKDSLYEPVDAKLETDPQLNDAVQPVDSLSHFETVLGIKALRFDQIQKSENDEVGETKVIHTCLKPVFKSISSNHKTLPLSVATQAQSQEHALQRNDLTVNVCVRDEVSKGCVENLKTKVNVAQDNSGQAKPTKRPMRFRSFSISDDTNAFDKETDYGPSMPKRKLKFSLASPCSDSQQGSAQDFTRSNFQPNQTVVKNETDPRKLDFESSESYQTKVREELDTPFDSSCPKTSNITSTGSKQFCYGDKSLDTHVFDVISSESPGCSYHSGKMSGLKQNSSGDSIGLSDLPYSKDKGQKKPPSSSNIKMEPKGKSKSKFSKFLTKAFHFKKKSDPGVDGHSGGETTAFKKSDLPKNKESSKLAASSSVLMHPRVESLRSAGAKTMEPQPEAKLSNVAKLRLQFEQSKAGKSETFSKSKSVSMKNQAYDLDHNFLKSTTLEVDIHPKQKHLDKLQPVSSKSTEVPGGLKRYKTSVSDITRLMDVSLMNINKPVSAASETATAKTDVYPKHCNKSVPSSQRSITGKVSPHRNSVKLKTSDKQVKSKVTPKRRSPYYGTVIGIRKDGKSTPTGSSQRRQITPTSSSRREKITPVGSNDRRKFISKSSSFKGKITPVSRSSRQKVTPTGSSVEGKIPLVRNRNSHRGKITPLENTHKGKITPATSTHRGKTPASNNREGKITPKSRNVIGNLTPSKSSVHYNPHAFLGEAEMMSVDALAITPNHKKRKHLFRANKVTPVTDKKKQKALLL